MKINKTSMIALTEFGVIVELPCLECSEYKNNECQIAGCIEHERILERKRLWDETPREIVDLETDMENQQKFIFSK